jgi:hypothetical protein
MTDVMRDIEAVEVAVDAPDAVDDGLVAELVARAQAGGVKLTGEGGLLAELTRRVLESALEGELTDHLGHEPGERAEGGRENYRNGHRSKTVTTEVGPVEITVPRDRTGTFEPQLVDTPTSRAAAAPFKPSRSSSKYLRFTSVDILFGAYRGIGTSSSESVRNHR